MWSWAPAGRARVGARPNPWKKKKFTMCPIIVPFFALWGPFSPCVGPFLGLVLPCENNYTGAHAPLPFPST